MFGPQNIINSTSAHSQPVSSGVGKREDLSDNNHLLDRASINIYFQHEFIRNRQKQRHGHTKKKKMKQSNLDHLYKTPKCSQSKPISWNLS